MTQTIDEGRAQLIASAQAVVAIHAEWSTPLPTHIESTLFLPGNYFAIIHLPDSELVVEGLYIE